MKILKRTRGQRDSWQQRTMIVRDLPGRHDPLDRKRRQKMLVGLVVGVLQTPNGPPDSLPMTSWQCVGEKK
jgi:hypothetical protein